jgi:hypothetical protein
MPPEVYPGDLGRASRPQFLKGASAVAGRGWGALNVRFLEASQIREMLRVSDAGPRTGSAAGAEGRLLKAFRGGSRGQDA